MCAIAAFAPEAAPSPEILDSLAFAVLAWLAVSVVIGLWWRVTSPETVAAVVAVAAIVFGLLATSWRGSRAALDQLRSSFAPGFGEVLSDRLRLRAPRSSDHEAYAGSLDVEMMAANGWTEEIRRRSIAVVKYIDRLPASTMTVIADRVTDELVGSIFHTVTGPGSCEMGWSIAPHARGRGYGTEAVRAAVAAAHRNGYRHVTMGTSVDNEPARRLIERIGGQLTRTAPHTLPNGTTIASVWYSLDSSAEFDDAASARPEAAPAPAPIA